MLPSLSFSPLFLSLTPPVLFSFFPFLLYYASSFKPLGCLPWPGHLGALGSNPTDYENTNDFYGVFKKYILHTKIHF
jgi:hypothetical protein